MKKLTALLFFLLFVSPCWAAHYYVSPGGNDVCYDGTTPLTAWRTIARVNQQDLQPGDIVSFQGGQIFTGTITLIAGDSGTLLNPVIFNSYGTGTASISAGTGNGVFAYNVTGITVSNLLFYGTSSAATSDGLKFYQDSQFGNEGITVSNVTARNFGRHGMSVGGWGALASVGAFRHVNVRDSVFHDNGSDGLNVYAQYQYANQDVNFLRVTAYNNTGNGTNASGSGMVLGGTTGGSILNSLAYENGATGVGATGIWTYYSANILIDTNTSHDNHSATIDGDGFDIDQNSQNVTMQNNTSYQNDGVGYLLAQSNSNDLHTGSRLLNNSSVDDGQVRYGGIRLYGQIENATITGNTVTSSAGSTPRGAVTFSNDTIPASFPQNITFAANNFTQTGPDLINMPTAVLSGAAGISFQDNSYTATPFAIVWGGTTYTSCEDWHTATGQETCTSAAPAPTVTSVTPSVGAQGATITNLAIVGTGFQSGATCDFGVNIVVTSCTFGSATSLTAAIMVGAQAAQGDYTVTVTNPDAQEGSLVQGFTVTQGSLPPPTVIAIAPSTGVQGDTGSDIVITGMDFQSGATCSFGAGITVNSCTFDSDTQLTANIDIAGGAAVGTRIVTVTNPDGQSDTLAAGFSVTQAPAPAPTVTSATPNTGAQGDTIAAVVIVGTNFVTGATCDFGTGITVNSCAFTNSTHLSANITIGVSAAVGDYTLTVTNPDMQDGSLVSAFTVTGAAIPAPTVSAVNPNSGAQGATLTAVVITGTNFQSGAACSFGTGITVSSCTFNTATQLTARIVIAGGATIGTRTVTVTNPDAQFGSAAAAFSVTALVLPAPTVTSAAPASGIQGQTLTVTISGTNFQAGPTCAFGSGITVNACSFVATTQLTASITIAAAATAGTRTVTVTNVDAQSGSKAGAFSVLVPTPPAPTVSTATPNSGAQAATATVVIAGTGFQSGATSSFGSGITVNSTTFNSSTQLTANISIALAAALGSRTVTVTNLDGQSGSAVGGFTVTAFVNPAPTISTVTPASGTQGDVASSIVLVGTGFLASPTCSFGAGISIGSCTRNSATQITAVITISASAAPGARTVTITNTDGQSATKSSGFTVLGAVAPAPTVTSTSPNSGAQGATLTAVLIAGTGFQSGATCSFGAGITVNSCTFNSSLQLTANITIAGAATIATRNVVVTNPDTQAGTGTAVFSVTAVVLPAPTLTSANPNTGAGAQTLSVVLTGTNFQSGATCTFGVGITVNGCVFNSATKLTASITIAQGAAVGGRTVKVTNPDAQSASLANGFTVTGPKFARVTWTDNSNNEDGFRLYRSDGDGAYAQVATTVLNITTYDDTAVPTILAFCYQVSAFNTIGESAKIGGTGVSCHLPIVAQPPRVAMGANEGTGTVAADSSGNGLNGTWNGGWTTDSGFGNALNFTATTSKLQITGLTTYATKRTWMARVRLTGPGGANLGRIFDKRTNGAESELFYYDNGNLRFLRIATTNGSWTMPAPSFNVWHNIAVSYDSGNLANVPRMWLDGVEQTVSTTSQPTGTFVNNTDPYCFGNRCGTNDRGLSGSLDEIRIFDRLITTFEVQSYMVIPLP